MSQGNSPVPVDHRSDSNECPDADGAEQGKPTLPAIVTGWRRVVFLFLAALFFALGVLGVLLPGIPATPFLLLTSYFLMRSSRRLNARLLRSRLFGPILIDWYVHGGVQRHVRWQAIVAVLVAVAVTIWFAGNSTAVILVIIGLATTGIVVVLKLPAAKAP